MADKDTGEGVTHNDDDGAADNERDDLLYAWSQRIHDSVAHVADPEKAGKYRDTALKAVAFLGDNALRRLLHNVREIKFYDSVDDLMVAYHRRGGTLENTRAFYSGEAGGSLHFNGARDTSEKMEAALAEVYAHEIGHAIDGPNKELSSSREWQSVWREEISITPFYVNQRVRKKADEGFAYFAHLIINHFRSAKLSFPKSFKFWQDEGFTS